MTLDQSTWTVNNTFHFLKRARTHARTHTHSSHPYRNSNNLFSLVSIYNTSSPPSNCSHRNAGPPLAQPTPLTHTSPPLRDISDLGHGRSRVIPFYHPVLLPRSRRSFVSLRHHQKRHIQPLDYVARGRQAAFQLKHGHHVDRKQKVIIQPNDLDIFIRNYSCFILNHNG